MTEVLTYLVVAIVAFFAGRGSRAEPPPAIDIMSNQVAELEEKLEYYKKLCLWHVEDKERLKRNES